MTRELIGKRVILTGASGGIGRATAAALGAAGCRVVLASRNGDALRALVAELPAAEYVVAPADITNPGDRRRLVDAAVTAFGGLDILVNNAGIGSWGHFSTSTEDIARRIMEVNF